MPNLKPTGWENCQDIKLLKSYKTHHDPMGKKTKPEHNIFRKYKVTFLDKFNSFTPKLKILCFAFLNATASHLHQQSNSCCANRALHFLETSPDHQCHLHHRQELANRRSWRMCTNTGVIVHNEKLEDMNFCKCGTVDGWNLKQPPGMYQSLYKMG